MSLLKAVGLGIQFGGLKAVDEFDFEIDKNQLYGLIGPNGAGKTTVFNLLTGVYKPTSGQVIFDGKSLLKMSPTQITQYGILLGRTSGFGQRGDRRNGEFSIEESSELYSYVTVGAQ